MSEIFEFAGFRLDVAERVLERADRSERISIPDKAFDTLCELVRNAGKLVEKEELLNKVWAGAFVEENNLNKSIHAIRRALGEKKGDPKFVETVKKHGFRFVAEVRSLQAQPGVLTTPTRNGLRSVPGSSTVVEFPHAIPLRDVNTAAAVAVAARPVLSDVHLPQPESASQLTNIESPRSAKRFPIAYLTAASIVVLAVCGALIFRYAAGPLVGSADGGTPTLAVLPLRPLDPGDNYLGLGVADAIIRRLSRTGTITVRPTSSVRRYLTEETDALTAARNLGVETIMEGTVLRSGDRLRVSVNLLSASDGRSLWSDSFDMSASDAFAIQDKVAQQVASSLQVRLDPTKREGSKARYTPSSIAYEYYLKGMYSFDQRGFNIAGRPQHEATIALFKKSIEADPNYAPAHAQLAYAYAWMGIYVDEKEQDKWVELTKEEISKADALDPQLPETHIARHHVLLSAHEGFQTEAAVRELIQAKKLDPNFGGIDLAVAYNHLGLEDMFDKEQQRTLESDPTSEFNKMIFGFQLIFARRYDDWLAYREKYFDGKPDIPYLMGKGRIDEAQQQYERLQAHGWDAETSPGYKAILLALKGNRHAAESEVSDLIKRLPFKNNSYHHATYDIACTYALIGKSAEAVYWLRETASTGFPSYPMFERDRYLDHIRNAPEFVQFMAEMKSQNERARQEFGQ